MFLISNADRVSYFTDLKQKTSNELFNHIFITIIGMKFCLSYYHPTSIYFNSILEVWTGIFWLGINYLLHSLAKVIILYLLIMGEVVTQPRSGVKRGISFESLWSHKQTKSIEFHWSLSRARIVVSIIWIDFCT